MAAATALRRALVEELERRNAIRSTAVRNAFLRVPRELFVLEKPLEEVYHDDAIPTKSGPHAVMDLTGDRPPQLQQLSGACLARLSARAKRRLIALSLDEPRRTRLGVHANRSGLVTYLSITLPVASVAAVSPDWGVGVVARDGATLA